MDTPQQNQTNASATSATPATTDRMPGHGGSNSPTSSQSLADSETSMGQGGLGASGQDKQPNKSVTPSALKPEAGSKAPAKAGGAKKPAAAAASRKPTAGSPTQARTNRSPEATNHDGNIGNRMEDSYQDRDRAGNRDSTASRGEFGAHGTGNTQGGYGNQRRPDDYNQHDNRGGYYGSQQPAGGYSTHPNSYRDYDGRGDYQDRRNDYDQRPDNTGQDRWMRNDRTWEGPAARPEAFANCWRNADQETPRYPGRDDSYQQPDYRNRNYYNRDNQGSYDAGRAQHHNRWEDSGHANDNGSRPGRDRGYSADYGHSSTSQPYGNREQNYGRQQPCQPSRNDRPVRNQHDDYRPAPRHDDSGNHMRNQAGYRAQPGNQRYDEPRHYNQRDYDQDYTNPTNRDAYDSRNYQGSNSGRDGYQGSSRDGFGSRGGSYNDEYDSGNRNIRGGSPSRGDYDQHDQARNYGSERRGQYRNAQEDAPDYGSSPRRNRGRDEDDQY